MNTKINRGERVKMLKAMEFIARNLNDEKLFYEWLSFGIADGDVKYGDFTANKAAIEEMEYYLDDETFSDLMEMFTDLMSRARRSGGLYCNGVVSGAERKEENRA